MRQTAEMRHSMQQHLSARQMRSLSLLRLRASEVRQDIEAHWSDHPGLALDRPVQTAPPVPDRPSLYSHLAAQIESTFPVASDRALAHRFLAAIAPSGWLEEGPEQIARSAGVPSAKAEEVLAALQQCEPTGVFARSLAECLRLQAREADLLTWEVGAFLDNMQLLEQGRTKELAARCDCTPEQLPEILRIIRSFDPKPGASFDHDVVPAAPPELILSVDNGELTVALNASLLPKIRVLDDASRRHRAEAEWLVDALERRNATTLGVATAIVRRQRRFLVGRDKIPAPLRLADVAKDLALHQSTVSRAISGRVMETPDGRIPLKSLFPRSLPGPAGRGHTKENALRLLRKTLRDEDGSRALNDTELTRRLADLGVSLARRTVAKYRKLLDFESSYKRRRAVGCRRCATDERYLGARS